MENYFLSEENACDDAKSQFVCDRGHDLLL